MMTSKVVGPAEVHDVGLAALENALGLMVDARALLEVGRPQSGYAIGVIAMEEAAKFNLCRLMLRDWSTPVTVVDLNEQLAPRGAHIERFRDFLRYLQALAPAVWPQTDQRTVDHCEEWHPGP